MRVRVFICFFVATNSNKMKMLNRRKQLTNYGTVFTYKLVFFFVNHYQPLTKVHSFEKMNNKHGGVRVRSVEAAIAKVVGDYDVRNCVENKLDVVRVRGTSHVAVYFFGCRLIFCFELCLDVCGRFPIFLST